MLEEHCGMAFVVGGIAWERLPIDPHPGPRTASEIVGARRLAEGLLLAGPETCTIDGARFAEGGMAAHPGEETLLVDLHRSPAAIAASLADAAEKLRADLLVCVDVGGDVLGNGTEPGLASPLCDAIMLAAAARLERSGVRTLGAVCGACCDGELTAEELLDRLAALAAAGGLAGSWGMTDAVVDELERVIELVPTEASAQAVRCARGEIGQATIRRGRRTVYLSPLGALTFLFRPAIAVDGVAALARAVMDADTIEAANDTMHELGVSTELDYERSFAEA
jgi:hypothetical protein